MKKFCLLMAALFTLVAFSSVAAARNRVALLPYINASEEHKGYVDEAVLAGYTFRFDNDGYEMVPEAEMARALENCDYTTDDEELPDKDQLILIYCRSGNRSKQAADKLVKLGYTNIVEFGGINDWTGETVSGAS